ncbi:23S rRNA (uracil(1939)-C(5))-methyltransferase RlmD [Bacteroidota bacterium]
MGLSKRGSYPLLESLEIVDAGTGGKSVARYEDRVIFVQKTVPGDIVDVQIIGKKKKFWEGYPEKFHKYSDKRIEPLCKHFGSCGGCKWQNMSYKDQLFYKQKQVVENLQRIGKVEIPEIKPILPSEETEYYRNKLEYTFSNARWLEKEELDQGDEKKQLKALGFHVSQRFDKIVNIEHCYLQSDPSNAIRLAIRDYGIKNGISFFDLRHQNGFLRNIIIRTSQSGETMLIVIFYHEDEEKRIGLLEHIREMFPDITSLLYIINPKGNSTIYDLDVKVFNGEDHIIEKMEDLNFRIGPKSFFQTNTVQACNLYNIVKNYAALKGDEVVYDLYTGTGTIANFIAKKCKLVIGIESVPEAIEDAKLNSRLNGINNTEFFAGDIKNVLNEDFITQWDRPEVIILDPPRAGMHINVVNAILFAEPQRIVYVSCNPATQARDIELLGNVYKVTEVQPVDMFPHTDHVENVVLLEKK